MNLPICMLGLTTMLVTTAPMLGRAETLVRVEGTEFVLTTAEGVTLRSADLQGATLKIRIAGRDIPVRVERVEEDADALGGRVVLHHFVVRKENGITVDLCEPDAEGRSLGFPVPDGRSGFELTCTSGAIGKCIRWGYRLWEDSLGGPPLQTLHQACVRMVRADYGGDGQTMTRDGIPIHVYDRFGVRPARRNIAMAFEAAWGADGALCVAHTRVPDKISLEQLGARYPRLRSHLGPVVCTEDDALRNPKALLFNWSAR
jgi:hypothetical protein